MSSCSLSIASCVSLLEKSFDIVEPAGFDIKGLSGCGTTVCLLFNVAAEIFFFLPLFALHFLITSIASPTVTIFPASSSGISMLKHSSKNMTSSTIAKLSSIRSSPNLLSHVISISPCNSEPRVSIIANLAICSILSLVIFLDDFKISLICAYV